MLDQNDIKKIEETAKEFFEKMTIMVSKIEASFLSDSVELSLKLEEPQILIGEKGQTLFEIQKLLRTILNKKTAKIFYLDFDIDDYKKKKNEYLKNMAKDLADEVALTKTERKLPPMPAYGRRAVHMELSKRTDVEGESRGEEPERYIIIKPK